MSRKAVDYYHPLSDNDKTVYRSCSTFAVPKKPDNKDRGYGYYSKIE